MKKITTFILLICGILTNAQTYIPMPVGYGTDFSGTNRVGEPLFQFGDNLYCKTRLGTDTQIGIIFKVNMTTNQVTELTRIAANPSYPIFEELYWDYGMQNLRNAKEINGEIYFNGWQTSIYKINPVSNTIKHLTNVAYDFEVLSNNLIPSSGYTVTNLDNLSQYYSPSITLNGDMYQIEVGSPNIKTGTSIYTVGTLYAPGYPLHSTKRLIRLDNANYPLLGVTSLYAFNSDIGNLDGFQENGGKPFFINNKIVWKRIDNNGVYLASFDISTNTFNPVLYTPDNLLGDYQFFINNNNLYIKNAQNQFLATNGTSTPILTSIPNFFKNGNDFCAGINMSYAGNYNDTSIIKFNGSLFGKDNGNTSADPRKIWKTDGVSTIQLVSDDLNLTHSKVYNSGFYAHGYNSITGDYSESKIYKFNNSLNAFESIWSFPNTGLGSFISQLYFSNNNVFFRVNANSSLTEGLYKLDLSTLTTQEFSKLKVIFSPNPTNSVITVGQEIKNLEVYDISGKKVKAFKNANTTFDVSELEKGIYLLKGRTNENTIINEKLVKY